MAEKLTPQQRMAVENRGGMLLVSAAAGSGKTKVLVDRLLGYLQDPADPANLDDFLIITYTKAAASELRSKIAAKLTELIARNPGNRHLQRQMQRLYLTKISTIHSFCGDILREYAYCLDLSADFRVADENECFEIQTQVLEQVLNAAYETAGEDPDFCAFVDTQGLGRDDRQISEIILKVYNSARCHLNPDMWLSWCEDTGNTDGLRDAGQTVWGSFLIRDLHDYLDHQIMALGKCADLTDASDGMEKPAVILRNTLIQLEALRKCTVWDDIVRHKNIDYGRLVFSKKCADLELAEEIKAIRNACKKGLEKKLAAFSDCSEQILFDLKASAQAIRGLIRLVREFESAYSVRKKARRILDFSDLEHKMLDLLLGKNRTSPKLLATEIGNRFREVMIDEYQDINEVQDTIFSALTHNRQNCFMVGDVKQSIYQFRLADPDIFIEKYNAYEPAEAVIDNGGRRVILSNNFRSAGDVVDAVNDVFQNCMTATVGGIDYGEDEMLREGIPHVSIPEPEVELYGIDVQEDTYAEEAHFVAKRIQTLLDGKHVIRSGDQLRPITAEDIVILLRSPGSVGGEFCYALERMGIPCTMGGGGDLLQEEEISVLCSMLQVISNPVQDIPLIAALTSRVFCFTSDDIAGIRGGNRNVSMYEALLASNSGKCKQFIQLLNELRLDARLYSLPQLIQRIFVRTKMDSVYAAMENGSERKENLLYFSQLAADYEAATKGGLDQFLLHLDSLAQKGLARIIEPKSSGSVTIMSIHKSKGLEFPVVILAGLSRVFNQESVRAQVLCDKTLGLGLSCVDTKNRVRYPSIAKRAIAVKMHDDSISEEMRVLYVAMTRPKDRLIMTYAAKNIGSDLEDISLRCRYTDRVLLTKEVSCPGEWVLQAAVKRSEAGAFFAIGGNPGVATVRDRPWLIQVVEGSNEEAESQSLETVHDALSQETFDRLRSALSFVYPYSNATQMPSKITATQLKGRFKDDEVAEGTDKAHDRIKVFRRPGFSDAQTGGITYGNAIHAVMQYIRYEMCGDVDTVKAEVERLVQEKLISEQQGQIVQPDVIARLFTSDIGIKLRSSPNILREFKFTLLDDSAYYSQEVCGEKILLQGVIDCAIIEPDGITVLDYKTDFVTEKTLGRAVNQYAPQVRAYGKALGRIYKMPIKRMLLYFFRLNRFVEVNLA